MYTSERNTQILIALLKAHGIKKIVASPGATNLSFVGSVQQDEYFEIFSSVDERSAAYMACGLAAESGETVVLSCTGATASRNYFSGLTEAYYRKLPILVITSSQRSGRIGHNYPQVTNRTNPTEDILKISVQADVIHDGDKEEEWSVNTKINNAILEMRHREEGPAHINLVTLYGRPFNVEKLPSARKIERITYGDKLPFIKHNKVAIFVGSHKKWSAELTSAVDEFCLKYNAVVLCDQTSNYRGKYRILANIITNQDEYKSPLRNIDLLIHIGDVSGAYMKVSPKETWRVDPGGKVVDTFKVLSNVFEMSEINFFHYYNRLTETIGNDAFYRQWKSEYDRFVSRIPNLPFSNLWIAQNVSQKLSFECVLHLGILNTLRSWNYFETYDKVDVYCNTGGFGIDGCVSSLIGSALANTDKVHLGIVGDLAFFYDLNSLGNRYLGKNVRLLVINNGRGMEFRNYNHAAAVLGDEADKFVAAAGHFGNKSDNLVKHFAEDLGIGYLTASNKQEFEQNIDDFLSENTDQPVIFEVFTRVEDENTALKMMNTLEKDTSVSARNSIVKLVGKKRIKSLKKLLGKGEK